MVVVPQPKIGRCVRQKASPPRPIYLGIAANLCQGKQLRTKTKRNGEIAREQTKKSRCVLRASGWSINVKNCKLFCGFACFLTMDDVSGKRRARTEPICLCIAAELWRAKSSSVTNDVDERRWNCERPTKRSDTARSVNRTNEKNPCVFTRSWCDHFRRRAEQGLEKRIAGVPKKTTVRRREEGRAFWVTSAESVGKETTDSPAKR